MILRNGSIKSMKICAISDTHGKHDKLKISECDILLHAGDFTGSGQVWETKSFLEWFSKQDAKYKIFCSGNHDFLDEENPRMFKLMLDEYPDITYLRDEMVEVEGLKIYGRPWTPTFYNWAFMADRGSPKMASTLSIIPSKIDILLTHGPAKGILDSVRGEQVGCEDLLNELERIQPKYMIFGHIHEESGEKEVNGIKHINASVLNDFYRLKFIPKVFTIDIEL